jgi:dienelactone hydrolase
MKKIFAIGLCCLFTAVAQAAIKTKTVDYHSGDTVMKGYVAWDDAIKGKRPGVLVVHEWWGHNDYARKRARMLAQLGYVAMSVDMYGDGKTAAHPKDAGAFSSAVMQNLPVAQKRFEAAMAVLKARDDVDSHKIAAIGYCFGGGVVLAMARRGVDLKGVVSFHGSLGAGAPAQKGKVKAKVLVYNGADDPFTKPEAIKAFKQEMTAADVSFKFVNLPGAKHSFTNPQADEFGKKFNLPLAYNKAADEKSWQGMQDFFKKIFK